MTDASRTHAATEGVPRGTGGLVTPASSSRTPEFAEVYDVHFDFVWRTIRRKGVAMSDVDDVVQDVFIAVAKRLPSFDPSRGELRGWLYGIVTNLVMNDRRRVHRKQRPCLPIAEDGQGPNLGDRLASTGPGPLEAAEDREALALATTILEALPEERREILILVDLEEMTVVEAAQSLELNVNTAHARLRAARADFDAALARFRARREGRAT